MKVLGQWRRASPLRRRDAIASERLLTVTFDQPRGLATVRKVVLLVRGWPVEPLHFAGVTSAKSWPMTLVTLLRISPVWRVYDCMRLYGPNDRKRHKRHQGGRSVYHGLMAYRHSSDGRLDQSLLDDDPAVLAKCSSGQSSAGPQRPAYLSEAAKS